jgi:hypothetical protein
MILARRLLTKMRLDPSYARPPSLAPYTNRPLLGISMVNGSMD